MQRRASVKMVCLHSLSMLTCQPNMLCLQLVTLPKPSNCCSVHLLALVRAETACRLHTLALNLCPDYHHVLACCDRMHGQ